MEVGIGIGVGMGMGVLLISELSSSRFPEVPGLGDFPGANFHTSEWQKDFSPKGKRIAVIGTGASAVQVVPALADQGPVDLTVFQRWALNQIGKLRRNILKGQLCGLYQEETLSILN